MILVDNFIDGNLLENLNDIEIYKSNTSLYSWYDKKEPSNAIEEFIRYAAKWLNIWDEPEGFEYWATFTVQDQYVGWHIDRDELYREDIADNSTIFYGYPHEVLGGMLEFDLDGTTSVVEKIAPTYNRLIYNPDANRSHRVTRVWAGERASLIFSSWSKKPKLFEKTNKVTMETIQTILNGDKK